MNNQRILILELGGIGDAIMAFPAIQSMFKHYAGAYIKILVVQRVFPVMQYLKDRIVNPFSIEKVNLDGDINAWISLIKKIRSEKYDTVIDLSAIGSLKAAIKRFAFLKSLGAVELIGRDTDKRGWAFTKKVFEVLLSEEHEVERKLKVAELAGADINGNVQNIQAWVNREDELPKDRKTIGINIGAHRPSRRWPISKVIALSKELLNENQVEIVFIGGETEKKILKMLKDSLNYYSPYIQIAFNLEFEELVGLLNKLPLLITNDTAIMHLAAILDVPMVITFDQNNAWRYSPYMNKNKYVLLKKNADVCPYFIFGHNMQECLRYSCDTQECMDLITIEEVKEAARSLLSLQ